MDLELEKLESLYTDLVNERVGGKAINCSDEWFAPSENLVKHSEPIFRKGHFVSTGQWMDGWESRRSFGRAGPDGVASDHDWCILRLGIPGRIVKVNVETTHFTGNSPQEVALDGVWCEASPGADTQWFELVARSPVEAHSHNLFDVASPRRCSHLRLRIFPDGGVARLRAWGIARPHPENYLPGEFVDLASVMLGGRGQRCSNMFYSSPSNLLMPYPGTNMGDGWETKRRRDEGHDWCVVRLGVPGSIRKVIVDTAHFKGNFPDYFTLDACRAEGDDALAEGAEWRQIIGPNHLGPDDQHLYIEEIQAHSEAEFTHVRLNIYPDGGVSRLRIIGLPNWDAINEPDRA